MIALLWLLLAVLATQASIRGFEVGCCLAESYRITRYRKIKLKLKHPINSPSGGGRFRVFATYLVHSLSSSPNIDIIFAPSLSCSGSMSPSPSMSSAYSGPRVSSSLSIFFGQFIGRFAVVLLVGLLHLLTEFLYFAIGLVLALSLLIIVTNM
jgi:hypothetical protein